MSDWSSDVFSSDLFEVGLQCQRAIATGAELPVALMILGADVDLREKIPHPQIVRVAQMLQQLFEPHVQLQRLALEFDEFGFRQEDAAEHYIDVVAVAETVVPARAYRQLAEPQVRTDKHQ